MDNTSFAHFSKFNGIVGKNVDIGAGTITASLLFDDASQSHVVNDRREMPDNFANRVYIGDYNRTGVNAVIMPGVTTGTYCVIVAGVILEHNLSDNEGIVLKQETKIINWDTHKYGI